MAKNSPNKNQKQRQATARLVLMAAILLCVNILASYFHTGLDLTQEKRFTLSSSTKKLLHNMQETAVVEVYMKGKFPAELQRLQEAVRERLMSFKDIAGNNIVFKFVNPFEDKTIDEQKIIAHTMSEKGMPVLYRQPQNDEEEENSNPYFFPYALVQYNGKEVPVMLLEDPPGKSAAEKISYAEALLEYKFASAINRLSQRDHIRIGYITGNGEDLGINSYDMLSTLPRFYDLDTINLSRIAQISLAYNAIIISQPTIPFTGSYKLKIDQYVMHGGHVLWALNMLNASLDTLRKENSPMMMAMELGLNLDDILYKYGVRVNNDLVEDMQCMQLPRIQDGGGAEMRDWIYFPKLNPTSDNPIVRNMDFIQGGFTNSIDTIRNGIKKTVLLASSKYSRTATAPVRVSLSAMNYPQEAAMFNKPYRPVAVLLEGKFNSVYQGRLTPEYLYLLDSLNQTYIPKCPNDNKMIITSIGDIFHNDYSTKDGILSLGYYKYTGEYFANKYFLLNCLEYLTDSTGILESRSKIVKARLLDTGRAKDEKTMWQVVNVCIPIGLVFIFASIYFFVRKRKYETRPTESVPAK
jgi:gliding-associated putative ABC transporter substrate-binding component GldG